jgi:hypothetical protein
VGVRLVGCYQKVQGRCGCEEAGWVLSNGECGALWVSAVCVRQLVHRHEVASLEDSLYAALLAYSELAS